MSDLYDQWLIKFEEKSVLEVKGTYYIKKPKVVEKEKVEPGRVVVLPEKEKKPPKKGLSTVYRKCSLVLWFSVADWPSKGVSVKSLAIALQNTFLDEGFLKLQSESTFWTEFRMRDLQNAYTRNQVVVMPLYECSGTAAGTSKNNRAFRFNLYEKYMKNCKAIHLRGVVEDLASYGSISAIPDILKQHVQTCEARLMEPSKLITSSGDEIVLIPGRIVNKGKKVGIPELRPILACYGAGIMDLPEINENKKSKKKKI